MKKLLTRERVVELLDRLNGELARTNTATELYVVGGAAMMLEYDTSRRTQDIDYAVQQNAFDVQAAAEMIAREEQDIENNWLNDHADSMGFLPVSTDTEARPSYQGSHLTVQTASPKRMLAMKMYAGRKEDGSDLMKLMTITGVRTMNEAMKIFEEAFPNTELPENGRKVMNALTSDPAQTPGDDTTGAGAGAGDRGGAGLQGPQQKGHTRGYRR